MSEKERRLLKQAEAEKERVEAEKERAKKLWEKLEDEVKRDTEAAKRLAPLTKAILLGTQQTEIATVTLIDGSKYQVKIRALGEGEIAEAQEAAGLTIPEIGVTPRHVKFQHALFSRAIMGETLSTEEIGGKLRFGESAKLATRILRLSGYLSSPSAEAIDLFR